MDTTHRVNARPHPPLVHAPSYDSFAAALNSSRVQEAMNRSRATLAGVRRERAEAARELNRVEAFSRDPRQLRIWLWTVCVTAVLIALCLCGAMVV